MGKLINPIASILLAWSAIFIAWNFYGLCASGGELVIREPIEWLRWLEFGAASIVALFSLYFLWHTAREL